MTTEVDDEWIQAKSRRDAEALLRLIDQVSDVDLAGGYDNTTALMEGHRNTELLQKLIAKGVDIGRKDNRGRTALMHAARYHGGAEAVELLLANGAEIDAQDNDGMTALMCAANDFSTATLNALLKHGANKEIQDRNGCTALVWAVGSSNPETVQVLIDAGANVNVRYRGGRTPLMKAASGYIAPATISIIKALLAAGADYRAVDEDGNTALAYAGSVDHWDAIQVLQNA